MIRVTDQLGKEIQLAEPAKRIVSLVPSQTELLHYLGLEEEVVGITRFCIHPENWFRNKQRVGGTKDFKVDLIRSLQPDLVLANKEENIKPLLEDIAAWVPVWTSDIHTLEEALQMVAAIGELTGKAEKASALIAECNDAFSKLVPSSTSHSVLYLIWKNPWMCAGNDTFIHDMLQRCGWSNACSEARYPELNNEALVAASPDIVFLSSEPFPFREKHIQELKQLLPGASVILVDGEYFSWYGSRMKDAPSYFGSLLRRLEV